MTARPSSAHQFNEETLVRQHLVQVALGQAKADLILRGATVLNMHTLAWKKDWDIVISGQAKGSIGFRVVVDLASGSSVEKGTSS